MDEHPRLSSINTIDNTEKEARLPRQFEAFDELVLTTPSLDPQDGSGTDLSALFTQESDEGEDLLSSEGTNQDCDDSAEEEQVDNDSSLQALRDEANDTLDEESDLDEEGSGGGDEEEDEDDDDLLVDDQSLDDLDQEAESKEEAADLYEAWYRFISNIDDADAQGGLEGLLLEADSTDGAVSPFENEAKDLRVESETLDLSEGLNEQVLGLSELFAELNFAPSGSELVETVELTKRHDFESDTIELSEGSSELLGASESPTEGAVQPELNFVSETAILSAENELINGLATEQGVGDSETGLNSVEELSASESPVQALSVEVSETLIVQGIVGQEGSALEVIESMPGDSNIEISEEALLVQNSGLQNENEAAERISLVPESSDATAITEKDSTELFPAGEYAFEGLITPNGSFEANIGENAGSETFGGSFEERDEASIGALFDAEASLFDKTEEIKHESRFESELVFPNPMMAYDRRSRLKEKLRYYGLTSRLNDRAVETLSMDSGVTALLGRGEFIDSGLLEFMLKDALAKRSSK